MRCVIDTAKGPDRSEPVSGFDSIAHRYDEWYESPVHQSIDAIEKAAIKETMPTAPRRGLLLDVGCGTGHWLLFFKMAGYRVVGLDLSPRMLGVAKSKFPSGIQLVRADAHRLPFEDHSFDIVCCITTLEFVTDHMRTLREMCRCLKTRGRLIVAALNAFSFLGIKRKLLRSHTFRDAHFFTTWELKRHLAEFGKPLVRTCAFSPPCTLLLPLSACFEKIGNTLFPAFGQLIVASLEKPESGPRGESRAPARSLSGIAVDMNDQVL